MAGEAFCLAFPRRLAPGDTVVLTALARDLHRADPSRRVFVRAVAPELLRHSPHFRAAAGVAQGYAGLREVVLDYGPGIRASRDRSVHFLAYLYEVFERATGIAVPLTEPRGALAFGPDEADRPVAGRYWVLADGAKDDVPLKAWDAARFAAVAAALRAAGLGVVRVGARGANHRPGPPIDGVLDLVGRTSLRDLMRIVRDSDGVVCGVSLPMHLAAALGRPAVVLAGAREAWAWEAYARENAGLVRPERLAVPHRYLHTFGVRDCTARLRDPHWGGCWKAEFSPNPRGRGVCLDVAAGDSGRPVPACLAAITPEHVMDAIAGYYRDGTLPPIAEAPPPVAASVAAIAGPAPAPPPAGPPELLRIEGPRGTLAPAAPVRIGAAAAPPPPAAADDPWASEAVGGRITAFVLCYGDYPEMHRQCLAALARSAPPERLELRVGAQALGDESAAYLASLEASGRLAAVYRWGENRGKYVRMRQLFHDPARPVTTPYLLWLDDDTIADVNPHWLDELARRIAAEHPRGARLFGPKYAFHLTPGQRAWIAQAPWYRGRPFLRRDGREGPDGAYVPFATGSLFAIAADVVRALDVPDARLHHNGGDWTIGAMVYQAGGRLAPYGDGKALVRWSSAPRRGLSERHPGAG